MKKRNIQNSLYHLPSKGPYHHLDTNLQPPVSNNILYGTLQTPKQNLITEIGNLNQLSVEGTSTFFGQTNFYNKVFLSNISTHQSNIGIESNLNVFGRIHLFDSLIIPENDIMIKSGKLYIGKQYLIDNKEEKTIECHGNLKITNGELIFPDGTKQNKGFEKIIPSPLGDYKNMTCTINEYGQVIKAESNKNMSMIYIRRGNTKENFIGILEDKVPTIEFLEKPWDINDFCIFRLHFSVFYQKNSERIYEKTSTFTGITYIYPYRLTSNLKLDSYLPSKYKWNGSIVGKNIFHFTDKKITPNGRPYWTVLQNPIIGNDVFYLYGDERKIHIQIINPNGWDSNEEYDYSLIIESLNINNDNDKYIQFFHLE